MQLFQMQVSKTAIYRTAPVKIPKGIMGAAVKLSFSPEWEGLTKTVVFRAGEITKDVLDVKDVAVIPAECTQEVGALLEIGVYGVDGESTVAIPTLWAAIGRVTEAADPSGDTTTDPQLPVWAQLLEMITQLEEQGVTQREIEAAVRDFFGGDRPVGQHTPEGGEIFNDYENNKALGENSSAEGASTTASGTSAHAEGYKAKATGDYSHAEGNSTTAEGKSSHAEGGSSKATGYYAHAEGRMTLASGAKAHAEGDETIAAGSSQHVQGKYNVKDTANKYAHIVGGGSSDTDRKNIHTIDWDGNAEFAGDVFVGTSREKLAKSSEIPQWAKASEKPDYTADEVGAAPAGFGLGKCTDKLPKVTKDTADTTTAAGWYEYYNVGVPLCDGNTGTDCGGLLVIPSMWGITQFFFCRNYYGGYLRRNYVAGADDGAGGHWEPWEWVNPPLLAGVEYRTTERYAGKPIYIKYISYTAPISITGSWTFFRIPHGISNYSTLDRLDARVGGGIVFPLLRQNDETISVESVNSANIEIRFKNSAGLNLDSGKSKLRFALHYTKNEE